MRRLIRPKEPRELSAARRDYRGESSQAEAWAAFDGKQAIRESLEIAQDGLCAYCENSLGKAHIDHFEPKSKRWQLAFDWQDLALSCSHPDSCGHKKGNSYDTDWINPYDEDPEGLFIFFSNGEIRGSSTRAEKTIADFGLDCPRLERIREDILKQWQESILVLADQPEALEYFLSKSDEPFPTAREQMKERLLGA
jgi:uncharacterized protein (TIGR02646 family)